MRRPGRLRGRLRRSELRLSLIVLEHATLRYGDQTILDDVSLRIGEREKIGLVGPNGAGKSTLLRVMMGQQAIDDGQVRHPRHLRIGYLPQELQEEDAGPLLQSVLESVPGRSEVTARLDEVEAALTTATDPDEQLALAADLAELAERLAHFEQFYSERQAHRILNGLGFQESDMDRPTLELSGGWRMRAALAGLLFQQPDILFLDEPTNHLDIPSVLWLDSFLEELRGSLVLICHDRDFLNRHIGRVLSFEPHGLESYAGNYDEYERLRDADAEIRDAARRNLEQQLKQTQAFVNRFKAKATKARQAQSRARRMKRMQQELDANKQPRARRRLSFSFPEVTRSGRDVVRLERIGKAFGDNRLYADLNRGIYAGDRIAIVGRNGAGKTTLLKIIAGELDASEGRVALGTNVQLGYYAQHHDEQLSSDLTVLDEVRRAKPAAGETWLRGVCGAFLFSRDEVDKKVGVLSGGERARVLLAKLLVEPGNLLLMDEPTNHLDVTAADALAEALDGFGGTLVFVSHNTSFVHRLATRVWDITNGELVDYPGTFADYLLAQQAETTEDQTAPSPETPKKKRRRRKRTEPSAQAPQQGHSKAKEAELRERIATLRAEASEFETELSDPALFDDKEEFQRLLRQFQDHQAKIEQLETRLKHLLWGPPPEKPTKPRGTVKRRRRRPRR